MRFNPKARLDTRPGARRRRRRAGRRHGRRRRCGIPIPGGTQAGGGIGGVIIVILFLVLTQCIGGGGGRRRHRPRRRARHAAGSAATPSRYANCKTGADANEERRLRPRSRSRTRSSDYWAETLPDAGRHRVHAEQHRDLQRRASAPAAARRPPQVGPVLLPAPTSTIYLDTTFFDDVLEGQLGGPGGDFVEPYVARPRVRPPHPEPARHDGQGPDPAGRRPATPCASSCRPTATPACGPRRDHHRRRDRQVLIADLDRGRHPARRIDAAKAVGDDRIQQQTGQAGSTPRSMDPRLGGAAVAGSPAATRRAPSRRATPSRPPRSDVSL